MAVGSCGSSDNYVFAKENTSKIKEVRRDIAKINTVLTERKIAESKQ